MVTKANGQLHRGIISVTFAITDTRINFVGTKLPYFPSSNNSQGRLPFFLKPKAVDFFEGGVYFKYCSSEVYILFHYCINHIKETEYGLLSIPNLVPWLILNVNSLDVGP